MQKWSLPLIGNHLKLLYLWKYLQYALFYHIKQVQINIISYSSIYSSFLIYHKWIALSKRVKTCLGNMWSHYFTSVYRFVSWAEQITFCLIFKWFTTM